MKKVITGFITYQAHSWDPKNPTVGFSMYEPSFHGTVVVREHSFEVEVADDFDPRSRMIDALKKEEQKAMADFQRKVTEIRKQISELQAIEMAPEVV